MARTASGTFQPLDPPLEFALPDGASLIVFEAARTQEGLSVTVTGPGLRRAVRLFNADDCARLGADLQAYLGSGVDAVAILSGLLAEMIEKVTVALEPAPTLAPTLPVGERIVNVTNRPLHEVSEDIVAALAAAVEPLLFVRSAGLVRVRLDEKGCPMIEPLDVAKARHDIVRAAPCMKVSKKKVWSPSHVEDVIIKEVLARRTWPGIPPLQGIVEWPVVRADGTVLDQPGYDRASELLYLLRPGLVVPPVPSEPTDAEVQAAYELVWDVSADFPFVDAAAWTNLLALLLTPIARPLITGPVPMALIDKPSFGTGASLLADVVASIITGRRAALLAPVDDDAEWRKRITSVLLKGTLLVGIDNVDRPLNSTSLASVLTALSWRDRILGVNRDVELPHRATWFATGNNIVVCGDLQRRVYRIRLDLGEEKPWLAERVFRHPRLIDYVEAQRGALLGALLTLVRGGVGAPLPDPCPKLGGFESWVDVIGRILWRAGRPWTLEPEQLDDDGWAAFMEAWRARWGDREISVSMLVTELENPGHEFTDAIPTELHAGPDGTVDPQRVGLTLRQHMDRVWEASTGERLRLERATQPEKRARVAKWRVRLFEGNVV